MTAREFVRRRGMLALMVGVPAAGYLLIFLALPDAPAAVEAVENGVKVRLTITQSELFGGFSSLIYVGLMAAVTGLYLMRSAAGGGSSADDLRLQRLRVGVLPRHSDPGGGLGFDRGAGGNDVAIPHAASATGLRASCLLGPPSSTASTAG